MKKFDWIDWEDNLKRTEEVARSGLTWTAITSVLAFIWFIGVDWFFRDKN